MPLHPLADTLLPTDVEMGVDFVDEHDARHRDDGVPVALLDAKVAIGTLKVSHDVDDERRDRAVAIAHAAQGKDAARGVHPEVVGIDAGHLVVVGQQAIGEQEFHGLYEFPRSGTPFEAAQMLIDQPGDAFCQTGAFIEERRQPLGPFSAHIPSGRPAVETTVGTVAEAQPPLRCFLPGSRLGSALQFEGLRRRGATQADMALPAVGQPLPDQADAPRLREPVIGEAVGADPSRIHVIRADHTRLDHRLPRSPSHPVARLLEQRMGDSRALHRQRERLKHRRLAGAVTPGQYGPARVAAVLAPREPQPRGPLAVKPPDAGQLQLRDVHDVPPTDGVRRLLAHYRPGERGGGPRSPALRRPRRARSRRLRPGRATPVWPTPGPRRRDAL